MIYENYIWHCIGLSENESGFICDVQCFSTGSGSQLLFFLSENINWIFKNGWEISAELYTKGLSSGIEKKFLDKVRANNSVLLTYYFLSGSD